MQQDNDKACSFVEHHGSVKAGWKKISPIVVFVVCVSIYMFGSPQPEVDCIPGPYTAWSLVRHGSFDVSKYDNLARYVPSALIVSRQGYWISKYPLGTILSALPVVAPLAIFRERPLAIGGMRTIGKIIGVLYVGAAVAIFFLMCREIIPSATMISLVLFAWGNALWSVASRSSWGHGPATFFVCLAFYFLVCRETSGKSGTLWAGIAMGLAMITRPTTFFFALASWMVLLIHKGWREAIWLVVSSGFPVIGMFLYNVTYFNFSGLVSGGYSQEAIVSWGVPNVIGLAGVLFAPSRGLFVYTPAFLLLPLGISRLRVTRSRMNPFERAAVAWWLLGAGVTVVLYSQWLMWWGGWSFGPRFLCETMPILCLTCGYAYASIRQRIWRSLGVVLVIVSVTIQFLGVFGEDGGWKARHEDSESMFGLRDTQIEAHAKGFMYWLGQ